MIYTVFEYICHQLINRTLIVGGLYLPCCARCAGIYCGFAVGAVYHLSVYRTGFKLWPTRAAAIFAAAVLAVSFVEHAATWWFGAFVGLANFPRFILGLSNGWAGFLGLAAAVTFVQFPKSERPSVGFAGVLPGFLIALAFGLLTLTDAIPAWYVLTWSFFAGLLFFYGFFNYFPVALAIRVTRWRPGALGYTAVFAAIAAALVGEWFLHRTLFEEITSIINFIYRLVGLT